MSFATILLAAGLARRFGTQKLLASWLGKPLICAALASVPPGRLIVVMGEDENRLKPILPCHAEAVQNPEPESGMGASIACGAARLRTEAGVFIALGDMPFVTPQDYAVLADSFSPERPCVPVFAGQRGHPVLFPASAFATLTELGGDQGAKHLLGDAIQVAAGRGVTIDIDDEATLFAMQHANLAAF